MQLLYFYNILFLFNREINAVFLMSSSIIVFYVLTGAFETRTQLATLHDVCLPYRGGLNHLQNLITIPLNE
jgi:hypothetical protein